MMLLPVPVYRQEEDGTCAVACLRMVVACLGMERSEAELVSLAESNEDGTSAAGVANAACQLGLQVTVWCRQGSERLVGRPLVAMLWAGSMEELWNRLCDAMQQGHPVIASLDTRLMGEPRGYFHSVVVVGVSEAGGIVTVNDPEQGTQRTLEVEAFRAAWEAVGNIAIVFAPRVA